MQSHDPTVPKALLPVAGRPFADWQLRWLESEGVESVVYSIGHKGNLIREFVGDGSQWGLSVTYVQETGELLGTGGAVRLAGDQGVLEDRFFVLYGDSYLRVNLAGVDQAFRESGLPALMTVLDNAGQWDASNVIFDDPLVVQYRKGLSDPPPQMHYIDYGLLEFEREVIMERIPGEQRMDLSEVLAPLSDVGLLGGFEVQDRFFEVGSPKGLRDLEMFLEGMIG